MKYFAIVTTDFNATHQYEQDTYDTKEGNFLRWPHYHLFKVVIKIEQEHNNRDIEFLNFKHWIENILRNAMTKGKHYSCEQYCEEIAKIIRNIKEYRNRELVIQVWEDGINGAEVQFEKDEPKNS